MRTSTRAAVSVLLAWLAIAAIGPLLPWDPDAVDLPNVLAPPSLSVPLGRDDLGRSVAARLAAGAAVSFAVASAVVAVAAVVGVTLGLLAGWRGGAVDLLLVRTMDVFLAFPGMLLAIALAGTLGAGLGNIVIALALVGWVGFARLTRAQTLSLRRRDHVLVARAMGVPAPVIVLRHVLPLAAAPLIVEATFGLAGVIVAEAGLSFLGLGIQAPSASWGSMIRDGTRYMLVAPHLVVVPGLALMSVVVALNLLGDRLRDRYQMHARSASAASTIQGRT